MRIIHGEGFRDKEREEARETIVSNLAITVYLIISQMDLNKSEDEDGRKLMKLSRNLLHLLSASEEKEVLQYIYELNSFEGKRFSNEIFVIILTTIVEAGPGDEETQIDEGRTRVDLLREIWSNYRFRNSLSGLTLFKLPDSALYFLSHFERILSETFVPLSEDIIRMRRATTGIQETLLHFGEVNFRLVDVGGQRSERKKWIHCFEDVSSIIFIASLAEYNLQLVEDQSVNRLGIFL